MGSQNKKQEGMREAVRAAPSKIVAAHRLVIAIVTIRPGRSSPIGTSVVGRFVYLPAANDDELRNFRPVCFSPASSPLYKIRAIQRSAVYDNECVKFTSSSPAA